jgi:hypothetical protein
LFASALAIARNGGMLLAASFNPMTKRILDAAVEVHRDVGPGLPESIYVEASNWSFATTAHSSLIGNVSSLFL